MRKDFYVEQSVAGHKTTVCSRAGSRSRVSSVELKPEVRTHLRRAPARIKVATTQRGLVTSGQRQNLPAWV